MRGFTSSHIPARRKSVLLLLAAVLLAVAVRFGWEPGHLASAKVASPPTSPLPVVGLSVPGEALIGEDFQFEVTFKNNVGMGFAPYLDLYLPAWGADGNSAGIKCDGITFVDAQTEFTYPPTLTLLPAVHNSGMSLPPPCPLPYGSTHPFTGATLVSTAPSGQYQLVVLALPFGSFDTSQPEIKIKVTAHLSDFADDGTPLTIYARGGFRYGGDEFDNHPGDPLVESAVQSKPIKPVVLKIKKEYAGPEDEAVAGPNFINYYPLNYKITADIADTQTIQNFTITDSLPSNLQFAGNVQVKIQGSNANPVTACSGTPGPLDVEITSPSLTAPGGTLSVKLCNAITGSPGSGDVVVTFDFYVPQVNSIPQLIIKKDCSNAPVLLKNDIKAAGDWDPLDPRDPLPTDPPGTTKPIISNLTNVDHTLSAKCLAIQKSVKMFQEFPGGANGPTPGDILQYELQFQVSDYFTIGRLVVTDFLANGLNYLNVPPPRLKVTDLFGTTGIPSPFPPATVTTIPSAPAAAFCPVPLQIPQTGSLVRFDVSQAMNILPPLRPRHDNGLLTGGWAAGSPVNIAATGTIVFYARIRDDFKPPVSPAHKYVDKHDPINNCVQIQGRVYGNKPRPIPLNAPLNIPNLIIGSAVDRSAVGTSIVPDTLKKTVHAVIRAGAPVCGPPSSTACSNFPNSAQEVRPGDQVTFRIEKEIPSSDAEDVFIEDWLPQPVFNVGDPDGDSTPGPAWTPFNNTACGVPASGSVCLGPTDTLHNLVAPMPLFFFNTPTNSLRFSYGTFNDPANQKRKIDLLFTLTATNKPFADGLFQTNEVQECEKNSFGKTFCQVSIAQVKVRAPRLGIKKGVVATDNPSAEFKPVLNPVGIWKPFGASCPRFNMTIPNAPFTSGSLSGLINSDLYYADANDSVTFAIAIENTGGAPAFNVEFIDAIPVDQLDLPSCFEPDFSGLCVTSGNGTPIPFTTSPAGHGRVRIKLGTPLDPWNSTTATTGTNIAIITFNAKLLDKDKLKAGCCDNTAQLTSYTSTPATTQQPVPPNFVDANLGGPFADKATIYTVAKAFSKCIVNTSEVHTTPQTAPPGTVPAAIGEIVRYRIAAAVPEGTSVNFQITDHLPAGMIYLGQPKIGFVSTTASPPSLTSTTISGPGLNFAGGDKTVRCSPSINPILVLPLTSGVTVASGSGGDVTFNLGDVTNTDSDANHELIVIEFNALVENVSGNVNGTTLVNGFGFNDACPVPPNNVTVSANVVEPNLVLTKTASPTTVTTGNLVNFSVNLTNNGTADAFDVVVTDPLPVGLTFVSGSLQANSSCASPVISGGSVTIPRVPIGCSVTITYQARVTANCPVTIRNTATADYTSLPGPNGTTGPPNNTTGSNTPGPSGAPNGERIYHASATAGISVICDKHFGSLTVNKIITTAPPPPPLTPPASAVFPVTVSCAPSGITQTFNLSATQLTQTISNIPIGNTCTVIEGPLPAPFGNPICAALGWSPPVYSPTPPIVISGPSQTVTITNRFACFQCAQPPTNMVAWWPMNVVNNQVNDIAPAPGSTFNNVGSAQMYQPVTGYVVGAGAGALFFNSGPGPVVIVPPQPELDFVNGDFSVDAWVRLVSSSSLGRVHPIVDKFNQSSGIGYAFYARNQRLELNINGNTYVSTGPLMQFANPGANTGPWYHVAVTVRRNPAQIIFYINGSQAGVHSPAGISNFVNGVPLWIGGSRVQTTWQELAIDELELFNRTLTQPEIQSIFNAGGAGKCRLGIP